MPFFKTVLIQRLSCFGACLFWKNEYIQKGSYYCVSAVIDVNQIVLTHSVLQNDLVLLQADPDHVQSH